MSRCGLCQAEQHDIVWLVLWAAESHASDRGALLFSGGSGLRDLTLGLARPGWSFVALAEGRLLSLPGLLLGPGSGGHMRRKLFGFLFPHCTIRALDSSIPERLSFLSLLHAGHVKRFVLTRLCNETRFVLVFVIGASTRLDTPANQSTMASQSKLSLSSLSSPGQRERTIRTIITELTSLYLQNRTRISRAIYLTLFVALINRVRNAISEQKAASRREAAKRAERGGTTSGSSGAQNEDLTKKKKKVELNREFFRSLLKLLRIVVPGWRSKETRLLISHSFFLVVRTLISLKVAAMDGAIVKALVKGNGKEFLMRIVWWMLIAVPATFTNSMVGGLLTLCVVS